MAIGCSTLESLGMTPAFWSGKRVLLTGHTGFKGSWLSLWLQSMRSEVVGYALAPATHPNLFDEAKVVNNMVSILADIRDLEKLKSVMASHKPEIVLHLAAQPLVRRSYVDPVETYSTNIMGTVHLLEAVRNTPGVKAVVNVTTDKCYENREWVWSYRESERMGGFDPYSSSKGCAELVTAAYRTSFFNADNFAQHGVALATARAGNVLGGGDWAQDRLIPDVLSAFDQGRPCVIRNPDSVRPWQYVLEPLRGYLTLAENLFQNGATHAEAWNFGPSEEDAKPVGQIVRRMAELWGEDARWIVESTDQIHEAKNLKLDISKARYRLDWHPVLRLDETLKLVVDWAKQRRAGTSARDLTLTQINTYQALTLDR